MEKSVERQIELIRRNTVEIIPEEDLVRKIERAIKTDTPLRVKIGLDPSRPDLHLGHVVVLQKLRDFQDLGHKAVLIVGDFTGFIGDPSGRDSERPALSWEEIQANAQTYFDQASKIIDYESAEVRYNSEWLLPLNFRDILALARSFTVHRMLERDDFDKRYREGIPISIMEFLYPLAQAYDSVAINADIELGGTDQRFNLMVGRTIQERYGQEPQCIVLMPLLEGTDGIRKMSKSLDNYVGITDEPHDIFGKVMRIPDEFIAKWRQLITLWTHAEREELEEKIRTGTVHPMEAKKSLAFDIVRKFYSETEAESAQAHFIRVFSERELPDEEMIETFQIGQEMADSETGGVRVVDAMVAAGLCESKGEARRLIRAGGVYWKPDGKDEIKVTDELMSLELPVSGIIRAGKRRVARLVG
ncbi:MAG TPA: tyrosine--tRNA ligase [Firmicutes bacterium]|nr:tyrosine--tRNA ligase [Bacillota bacterium]